MTEQLRDWPAETVHGSPAEGVRGVSDMTGVWPPSSASSWVIPVEGVTERWTTSPAWMGVKPVEETARYTSVGPSSSAESSEPSVIGVEPVASVTRWTAMVVPPLSRIETGVVDRAVTRPSPDTDRTVMLATPSGAVPDTSNVGLRRFNDEAGNAPA